MPLTNCENCSKEVYKRPWKIARGNVFCSRECSNRFKMSQFPEALCVCVECGKSYRTNPAWARKRRDNKHQSYCSRKCMWKHKRENPPEPTLQNGYLYQQGKYLHRSIMEEHIGRKLNRNEHVHHINGDKTDNRIENLAVIPEGGHHSIHSAKRRIIINCNSCGIEKEKPMYYINQKYKGDVERFRNNYQCQDCYRANGRLS